MSEEKNTQQKGMTRREFVKGVAVGAAGMGLVGILPGPVMKALANKPAEDAGAATSAASSAAETVVKKKGPPATMGDIATKLVSNAQWQSVSPAQNTYGLSASAQTDDILRLTQKGLLAADAKVTAEDTVAREDFFLMMGKALGTQPTNSTSMYKFKDVADISPEALPVLSRLYTRGILTGDEEANTFGPKDPVTVDEVDDALDRAYHKQFAPAGTTLVPLSAPYLTKNFNRFGKMDPSLEAHQNIHLLKEKPFNIIDNIYYVGNTWASSYLIDTGDGLILLDNPTQDYYALLIESIYEMGFDPKDIKIIILSHAHGDHYGCVKLLKDLCPNAITIVGDVDAPALVNGMQRIRYDITTYGYSANGYYNYNEGFIPDRLVTDGDFIELGNTKIECITTPGHTDGVQSHFWTTPSGYRIGLYGGAGFSAMATNRLAAKGYDEAGIARWQEIFVESIDKVWDRDVDVMLGNHPFHADLFEKNERFQAGDKKAFIDPTEWHRYLQELKDCYVEFLKMTPEEVSEMYSLSYLLIFRDQALERHEWPWVEDGKSIQAT